jgi:hypothetical protein
LFIFFFLQRIFNSFVYTEKISNGESEVQQVRSDWAPDVPSLVAGCGFFLLPQKCLLEASLCSFDVLSDTCCAQWSSLGSIEAVKIMVMWRLFFHSCCILQIFAFFFVLNISNLFKSEIIETISSTVERKYSAFGIRRAPCHILVFLFTLWPWAVVIQA